MRRSYFRPLEVVQIRGNIESIGSRGVPRESVFPMLIKCRSTYRAPLPLTLHLCAKFS